jgi:hypothetical protein
MAIKKALIHRYDNKPDMLAVEKNGCSEVYKRSRDKNFDLVIVVPTQRARTSIAIVADAASEQYTPALAKHWPGRPDRYPVRIDVQNVRRTTMQKVREAMAKADKTWVAAWVVCAVELEENDLF